MKKNEISYEWLAWWCESLFVSASCNMQLASLRVVPPSCCFFTFATCSQIKSYFCNPASALTKGLFVSTNLVLTHSLLRPSLSEIDFCWKMNFTQDMLTSDMTRPHAHWLAPWRAQSRLGRVHETTTTCWSWCRIARPEVLSQLCISIEIAKSAGRGAVILRDR